MKKLRFLFASVLLWLMAAGAWAQTISPAKRGKLIPRHDDRDVYYPTGQNVTLTQGFSVYGNMKQLRGYEFSNVPLTHLPTKRIPFSLEKMIFIIKK